MRKENNTTNSETTESLIGGEAAADMDPRDFARKHDLDVGENLKTMLRLMDRHCAVMAKTTSVQYLLINEIVVTVIFDGEPIRIKTMQVIRLKRSEFVALFENAKHTVDQDGKSQKVNVAITWLARKLRREYRSETFLPDVDTPPDVLNLWCGWAFEPKPGGDWSMLREHILQNICNGNFDYYEWLLDWLADIFQNPARKPGTAIVLRGAKGTGKTKLAEIVSMLCGAHGLTVDSSEKLLGKFNYHLAGKLVIVADEAVWGGSKQAVGVLNSLITNRSMLAEPKGLDLVELPSFHRIIMTANAEWVVPATRDERRFFVLDVGNGRRKDRTYFQALDKQMLAGGFGGMLHDLLTRKITRDVGYAPVTRALGHQIAQGLKPVERMLVELANEGALRNQRGTTILELDERLEKNVPKSELWGAIRDRYRHPPGPREIGGALKAAGIQSVRPRDGEHRPRLCRIPPRCELIRNLEKHFGTDFAVLCGEDASEDGDDAQTTK